MAQQEVCITQYIQLSKENEGVRLKLESHSNIAILNVFKPPELDKPPRVWLNGLAEILCIIFKKPWRMTKCASHSKEGKYCPCLQKGEKGRSKRLQTSNLLDHLQINQKEINL